MTRRAFSMLPLVLAAMLLGGGALGAEPQPLRVLMIGNSYTAQTHAEFTAMLAADPAVKAEVVTHCPDGRTIAEHAANPKVAELLTENGKWDVVIVQEQSQLPALAMTGAADGPLMRQLDAGAPVLIPRIHRAQPGTRIILMETWARHRNPDRQKTLESFGGKPEAMQAALTDGYRRMVCKPGAWDFSAYTTIAPVGRAFGAWYAAQGYDKPELKLHKRDNSHPAKNGAYLTGLVLYEAVTGRSAETVTYDGGLTGTAGPLPLATALKQTAHRMFPVAK